MIGALPLSDFYPRPPRGGRPVSRAAACVFFQFLSTPSARRATHLNVIRKCFFSISIHALREEGDFRPPWCRCSEADFYPRPPRGGRRCGSGEIQLFLEFLSTPSARRATVGRGFGNGGLRNFYPRPPRGGRLLPVLTCRTTALFLSTPSARRATNDDL